MLSKRFEMISTYVVIDHRKHNLVKNLDRVYGKPPRPPQPDDNPLQKYNDLPIPDDKCIATYIWVDGSGENLRCKEGTLNFVPEIPKSKFTKAIEEVEKKLFEETLKDIKCSQYLKYMSPFFCPRNLENVCPAQCRIRVARNMEYFDENLKDLPIWTYDGSETGQAKSSNSDMYLFPRAIYRDPFRRGNSILVMCDSYNRRLEPTATNHRVSCLETCKKCKEHEPWFGFEQEFYFMNLHDNRPFGWPQNGFPMRSSRYFCAVNPTFIFGREIMEAHYRCCLYAGIPLCGQNAEIGPSQWEYQIGPSVGIDAGDDLWVSRFIMERLALEYGVTVCLDPKPIFDWNGCGAHTNFSTKQMRKENGIMEIENAINKLSKVHPEHLEVYDPHEGKDNQRRLTNQCETGSWRTFTVGIAERFRSIRLIRDVSVSKKGYFEDRRPASNCDPYLVINALLRTCVLNE